MTPHPSTGLTEWFDDENDINHMLRPSKSTDLDPTEHAEHFGGTCQIDLSTSIIKTLIEIKSFGRIVFIPPVQF